MNLKNKDIKNVIEKIISRWLYTYNYAERKSIKIIILSKDTTFLYFGSKITYC